MYTTVYIHNMSLCLLLLMLYQMQNVLTADAAADSDKEEGVLSQCDVSLKKNDGLLKDTLKQVASLYDEINGRYQQITALKEELKHCKGNTEAVDCDSVEDLQMLDVSVPREGWFGAPLEQGFGPGSRVIIRGRAKANVPRLQINLLYPAGAVLHIDNRWNSNAFVMNTLTDKKWGTEIARIPAPLANGANFSMSFQCEEKGFKICANGVPLTFYPHRVSSALVDQLDMQGVEEVYSIHYEGPEVLLPRRR